LNLQGHQIPIIAKTLMDEFKGENLADFTICFRRGVMGLYSDEKDKLLRIDGAVIVGWMRKYLDEKYQVIENQHTKAKRSEPTKSEHLAFLRELMERTLKETGPIQPEESTNAAENAYQRYRVNNQSQLSDDHCRKILKQEYPEATSEQIEEAIKSRRK
jgi:hypothetical protein